MFPPPYVVRSGPRHLSGGGGRGGPEPYFASPALSGGGVGWGVSSLHDNPGPLAPRSAQLPLRRPLARPGPSTQRLRWPPARVPSSALSGWGRLASGRSHEGLMAPLPLGGGGWGGAAAGSGRCEGEGALTPADWPHTSRPCLLLA